MEEIKCSHCEGSEAYVVNNFLPKHVSKHAGLWSEDLSTIQGSSHTMYERDANIISTGSGMAFHTINGKLYTYSSGDVRDNPEMFKELVSELVDKVQDLKQLRERG